jgi:hypothetical protein
MLAPQSFKSSQPNSTLFRSTRKSSRTSSMLFRSTPRSSRTGPRLSRLGHGSLRTRHSRPRSCRVASRFAARCAKWLAGRSHPHGGACEAVGGPPIQHSRRRVRTSGPRDRTPCRRDRIIGPWVRPSRSPFGSPDVAIGAGTTRTHLRVRRVVRLSPCPPDLSPFRTPAGAI